VILAAAISLTGCATIMEGTGQSVTISTDPAGAACTVDRGGTRVGQVNPTPGSLRLDKSKDDLQVACTKDGFQTSTVSRSSKFVGTTFGNIIIGGLTGVLIDAVTGANFTYPSEIKVSLAAGGPMQSLGFTPVAARIAAPLILASAGPTSGPINGRREFGIRADAVNSSRASAAPLGLARGVLVMSVIQGGAAASAGLAPGDIILTFGGSPVASIVDMERVLAVIEPHSKVSGEIWRDHRDVPMTFDF
jgi:membrane-associated protease RseP (regulator of RpoE activity)